MVKNKKWIVLIISILMVFLIGCSRPKEQPVISEEQIIESDNNSEPDVVENEGSEAGVPSPISGIVTQEENINRRPITVMLDNQSKARPQAGLDQAEMVYEFLAEGWITRYLAVFLINEPESIGPVRSARSYFIDKALEFNALYVHVGGSPQAFEDIKALKVADIDAMSRDGSIFWRKNHKKQPHNMYTSTQAIRKAAKQSNYQEQVQYEALKFNGKDEKINGTALINFVIPYKNDYKPSFKYDIHENIYYRYINDKPHLDEVSQKHLSAKNIIIQKAQTKVIDSEGRLEIGLVGKGKGAFITGGEMQEITWEKSSRRAITRYYDKEGKEISLNPGVTWVQVVPLDLEIISQ